MLYISDSRYTLKLNKHSCNKHAFIALFPSSNYVLTDEQSLWIEDTTKSVYQVSSSRNKPMIEQNENLEFSLFQPQIGK